MIWIIILILLILVVCAIIFAAGNARRRDDDVDAMAVHESLRRNHPDSPLSQLGPNEFLRAYEAAVKRRQMSIAKAFNLWALGGFVAASLAAWILFQISESLGIWVWVIATLAALAVAVVRCRVRAPAVLDLMQTRLDGQGG